MATPALRSIAIHINGSPYTASELFPCLEYDRLDFPVDRPIAEPRRQRFGRGFGHLGETLRVARLDLAAQGRTLAEADRGIAWRGGAGLLGQRLGLDRQEACGLELATDRGFVVIAIGRALEELGRILWEAGCDRVGHHKRYLVFFDT